MQVWLTKPLLTAVMTILLKNRLLFSNPVSYTRFFWYDPAPQPQHNHVASAIYQVDEGSHLGNIQK